MIHIFSSLFFSLLWASEIGVVKVFRNEKEKMTGKGEGEGDGLYKLGEHIALVKYVLVFTNAIEWVSHENDTIAQFSYL